MLLCPIALCGVGWRKQGEATETNAEAIAQTNAAESSAEMGRIKNYSKRETHRDRVVFSDETTFELHLHLKCRPGVAPAMPGSVSRKREASRKVQEQKDLEENSLLCSNPIAKRSCRIYTKAVLPRAIQAFGAKRCWTLQEDNDPKHRSIPAEKWCQANRVRRMPRLSHSPDMSPREHVWIILNEGKRCQASPTYPLMKWIRREWAQLPMENAQLLVESMKACRASLLQKKMKTLVIKSVHLNVSCWFKCSFFNLDEASHHPMPPASIHVKSPVLLVHQISILIV